MSTTRNLNGFAEVAARTPSPNYDAGDRTGRLPEVIPLDFPSFMKAFNNTAAGAAASAARPKPEPTASAAAKPQQ